MKDNREYASTIRAAMVRMSKLNDDGTLKDEEPVVLHDVKVTDGKNGS